MPGGSSNFMICKR